MTIHRVEYTATPVHNGPHIAVSFCGIEERFTWPLSSPTMTHGPEANCTACAEKMEATRMAEWAAVKP